MINNKIKVLAKEKVFPLLEGIQFLFLGTPFCLEALNFSLKYFKRWPSSLRISPIPKPEALTSNGLSKLDNFKTEGLADTFFNYKKLSSSICPH